MEAALSTFPSLNSLLLMIRKFFGSLWPFIFIISALTYNTALR